MPKIPFITFSLFSSRILLPCLMILFQLSASSQTQLGADIYGENGLDRLGAGVAFSADGTRLVASARFNDDSAADAGHVRVYDWNGSSWEQIGADIDGEAAQDYSGQSVALSADGTRLVIGAPHNDDAGEQAGHVRMYQWNDNEWQQLGNDIDGEAAGESFGWSVAISADGNRLVVGALGSFNGEDDYDGSLKTYEWDNGEWMKVGSTITGEGSDVNTGYSADLSADGNRLAVSSSAYDHNETNTGRVSVYDWIDEDWMLIDDHINGDNLLDRLGHDVSLSADGNILAISSVSHNGGNEDFLAAGLVRVYNWTNDTWIQMGSDLYGVADRDRFGYAIALSADGQRLLVSTLASDESWEDAGKVEVFDWIDEAWTSNGIEMLGEAAGDNFGYSVALSDDGNRIAVGAIENDGNFSNSGQVKVFEVVTTVAVTEKLLPSVRVFPNPTAGTLQISGVNSGHLQLSDQLGRVLYQVEIKDEQTSISMRNMPNGVYFLQINSGKQHVSKRIVKK